MLLWKRGPFAFSALALCILAANLALNLLPAAGIAVAQMLLPLLECGLLYASLAADRGDRPRIRHLLAVAGASPGALAAVVIAGSLVFGAEALVALQVGGIDMLSPAANASVSATALIVTYAAGMLVSLPVTFVPFAALFDGAPLREAFAQSFAAFRQEPRPARRLRRAVVRAAAAGAADQRPGTAARAAVVGRGVLRRMEGHLRGQLIARRPGRLRAAAARPAAPAPGPRPQSSISHFSALAPASARTRCSSLANSAAGPE